MNLSNLLKMKAWTPLRNIPYSFYHLEDDLYQFSKNLFVVAQPYNKSFEEGLPDAPFVTVIYWAVSIEAIKRCFFRDTQFFNFPTITPPSELLLGTNGSYGELVKLGDHLSERTVYKGTDGSFLHNKISINNYSYFFVKKKICNSQLPYAIEYLLV